MHTIAIIWNNGDEIVDDFGSTTQNNYLIRFGIKGALDGDPLFIHPSNPKATDGS